MNFETDTETLYEYDEELREKINNMNEKTNYFDNATELECINVYIFYIVNKKLFKYKKIDCPLQNNSLMRDELLSLSITNRSDEGKQFQLIGIYSYNFNVEPENLYDYVQSSDIGGKRIKKHKKIEEIHFEPGIDIFQENNSVFMIYENQKKKQTRKVKQNKNNITIKK